MTRNSTTYKTIRAVLYVSLSSLAGGLVSYLSGHPDLFGPATVIVNGLLVALKDWSDTVNKDDGGSGPKG